VLGIGNVRSIHLLRWARTVAAAGHEVHLASDREPREDDPPASFHSIQSLGLATRVPFARRAAIAPALGRLARRLDADVVHAHYLLPYGYWAARSKARPLVMSPWGTDALVAGRAEPGRPLAEEAVRAADLVVVNSRALEQASLELGARAETIRNVFWHLDLDGFAPERADPSLRASLGWPDDALVVLSLRNFRPDTNLDVLVKAFARVSEEEPRARLVLAADTGGPLRTHLEGMLRLLEFEDRVAFHHVAAADLPGLVAAADVVVSIANSDSTPPSLLEAMVSGRAVVCAAAASIDEWVGAGEGAEIVSVRDAEETAAAILGLLQDEERRRAYGERNRRVVRETVGDPGPELDRLYRELAAS
jgi:glycosyltransferase involved in cell wall biosynthesis